VTSPITALIAAADAGEPSASEELFGVLYAELHRLARFELARRGPHATLGVTTLVHEAYLSMAGREDASFPDRARFMGYAARVMRGLITDPARRRRAVKRGAAFEITSLDTTVAEHAVDAAELSAISDALNELSKREALLAEIVDLKFFCGFSFTEIAEMLGVAERTVRRKWEKARIYLHRALQPRSFE
jgi:RNA polymerase sigma factor (TIGR02999 family)